MSHLLSKLTGGHLYKSDGHLCKVGNVILKPVENLACQYGGYVNGVCNSGYVYNWMGNYSGNWSAANDLRNAILNGEESTLYTWQYGNYEPRFALVCGAIAVGCRCSADIMQSAGSWAMYPAKRFALPSGYAASDIKKATVLIKGVSSAFLAANNAYYGNVYRFDDWINNNSISGMQISAASGNEQWRYQSIAVHTYGSVGEYYPRYSHQIKNREWVRDPDSRQWYWRYYWTDFEDQISSGKEIVPELNPTLKAYAILPDSTDRYRYQVRSFSKGGAFEKFVHFQNGNAWDALNVCKGASWYDSSDGLSVYCYDLDQSDLNRLAAGNLWVSVTPCNNLSRLFVCQNAQPGLGGMQQVTIDDYKIRLEFNA